MPQNKLPHILYSVAWYPNASGRQCSTFIKNHALAISKHCKLSVLGVFPAKGHKTIKIERKTINKNLIEYLVYVPKFPVEKSALFRFLAGLAYFIGYCWGLINILSKEKGFSMMHVNVLTRAGIIPWLINALFNIPYIVTEHWSRYFELKSFPEKGLHHYLTKRVIKNASSVHCASKRLIDSMQKAGLSNKHYFRFKNCIDINTFNNKKHTLSSTKRFITISRLVNEVKNISGILTTLARLKKNNVKFEYIIIGDGPDYNYIEDLIKSLQLSDEVSLKGFIKNSSLPEELSKSNCTLLFSNYESQPVSIIESLACGVPVIATKVGDIDLMIPEGCGTTLNAKDEDRLYEEIAKVIEEKTEYSSTNCIEEAKKYSFEKVGLEFNKNYIKTLKDNAI